VSLALYQKIERASEYTDTVLWVSSFRLEKAELTAVFVSFGDESGNHTNERSPFMALAGYVGHATVWRRFKEDWARALADFNLTAFHMTDYLGRKTKPYCEWSNERYEKCIERFIDVINIYNLGGFAVQVPRDDFDSLISLHVKKKLINDPYILVFDTAITLILRWMFTWPRNEQVTMYFHRTSFKSKAKRVYERRRRNDPQGFRLPKDVHFVSDEFLPIQAADLLASLARNFSRSRVISDLPIKSQIEKYLIRLNKRTKTQWYPITKEKLQATDRDLSERLEASTQKNGKSHT